MELRTLIRKAKISKKREIMAQNQNRSTQVTLLYSSMASTEGPSKPISSTVSLRRRLIPSN